jgi:hypothetical protein
VVVIEKPRRLGYAVLVGQRRVGGPWVVNLVMGSIKIYADQGETGLGLGNLMGFKRVGKGKELRWALGWSLVKQGLGKGYGWVWLGSR